MTLYRALPIRSQRETIMTAAGTKLAFDNGGAFIQDTRREVEQYLARGRTRVKGAVLLYSKAPIALALTVCSWVVLMFVRPGIVGALLCLLGLALGATLTAFCVQHDANHGAYFRQRRYNHLVGWSSDLLLGFSSYAWRVKHNVAHHTYTNVDGFDADATQVPLARFTPSQTVRPWYRFQQYYIWPMYMLMGLRWQIIGDLSAFRRGAIGESALRIPRGWNLVGIFAGKAFFISWAIVIPLLVYPWWVVLAAYVGFGMVTSLIMATTFQLAHCVEEASFASADELRGERRIWAVHEVETTVDFCPRNPVLTWMLGGLNYQIEHHLFPGFRTPTTRRSPRSCAETASSTTSGTHSTPRSGALSARISCICGQWVGWDCRPRSRWDNEKGWEPAGRLGFPRALSSK